MLNIFPSACYFFFQFSKKTTLTWKNFYQANLENCINKILAWSESQLKLSSLVSCCADFTRWWPIQVMNHWRFGFFEEKPEDLNISCLALPPLPWWPGLAWTCLVCLKAGPTLVAMALLIGQIKELTQYWVSSTNQSKEDLSCGQAFKPPRQAQANSQLNQKYCN